MDVDSTERAISVAAQLAEQARWEEAEALLDRFLADQKDPLQLARLKLAKVQLHNDYDWCRGLRDAAAKHQALDEVEAVVGETSRWLYAEALYQRGMALHIEFIFATGDLDRELDCFTRAAELFTADNDTERAALATVFIGIFHHVDRLDRDTAVPFLRRAYDMVPPNGGSEARAEASRHLGQILQEQGDLAAALPLLEESLALRAQSGDTRHLASALHAVGYAAMEAGDLDRADDYLIRARQLGEQFGNRLFLTMIAQTEADLAFRRVTGPNLHGRSHP